MDKHPHYSKLACKALKAYESQCFQSRWELAQKCQKHSRAGSKALKYLGSQRTSSRSWNCFKTARRPQQPPKDVHDHVIGGGAAGASAVWMIHGAHKRGYDGNLHTIGVWICQQGGFSFVQPKKFQCVVQAFNFSAQHLKNFAVISSLKDSKIFQKASISFYKKKASLTMRISTFFYLFTIHEVYSPSSKTELSEIFEPQVLWSRLKIIPQLEKPLASPRGGFKIITSGQNQPEPLRSPRYLTLRIHLPINLLLSSRHRITVMLKQFWQILIVNPFMCQIWGCSIRNSDVGINSSESRLSPFILNIFSFSTHANQPPGSLRECWIISSLSLYDHTQYYRR
ncbi:hypothetical protein VP01_1169g1 [Puccinia sorghi]|uniref:Uncharacterized protein n=1 Tax=Puccinia sorghi TaxID=27349 RepID=A0A0L6VRH7_9BASI|nr:hypothetical protein VP01_1169g1 [Puccinia sorghi]